jgi:transcriptional regulator with XRE-family HTH domain
MNLGVVIKSLRKKKGYKQNSFAELCDITPSYLSQIESNNKEPNISTLKIISEKLDVPLPIIFFLSLDQTDIKSEKIEMFNQIDSSIKAMIEEFFGKVNLSND